MKWYMTFTRKTKNKLSATTTKMKLSEIAGVTASNPALGFTARVGRLSEPKVIQGEGSFRYMYVARIRVSKPGRDPKDYENIRKNILEKASREQWELSSEDEDENHVDGEVIVKGQTGPRPEFILPDLTPQAQKQYFRGVYERDPHIRIIHAAVKTCIESNGKLLSHVLLYGQPGACKTKLTEKFKDWYDQDSKNFQRVLFVDGTSMTKAGLENWLLELADVDCLPDILVVDELEKQPMDNLLCLNGIMGSGTLAKLDSRRGNARVPAKFVVIGICNDKIALKNFRSEALWSRFTHKLHCERPSKALCLQILKEITIQMPNGQPIWAEKAMEFGWDELGQRDIREIKGHLDGRERLMTGEWQKDKRYIINSEKDENKEAKQERVIGQHVNI
jgi:hypothetical protein